MGIFHYHNHSDGSLLDGSCKIDRLVSYAKESGVNAIGLTDHGNMIKIFEFWKKCNKEGVKPILGCEFYMGEPNTTDKFHIIVLAKNNKGLHNMYKLQEFAWTKNFYSKPRITMDKLIEYKEGLIITTACLGGEVAKTFMKHSDTQAIDVILGMDEEFEDFYLELQPQGTPEQIKLNKFLLSVGKRFSIPCVVGCDAHYIVKDDAEAHDTMLCMQVQKKKNDDKRFKMNPREFYLKSEEEIIKQLNIIEEIPLEDVITIINNTNNIPNLCNATIETGLDALPHFTDNAEYMLALECNKGYKRRYGNVYRKDVVDRVKYELSVIKEKGYPGYFLIVQDFLDYARSKGILIGDGRGSCCGSMVAYLLGIHNIDPIKYGLFFERFLNPTRNSPPDIDSDIQYDRRGEVIEYVVNKYGYENVCQIMAEGKMKTKKVVRSVLSSYDFLQQYINKICKSIPDVLGISLKEAYDKSEEFRGYMDKHKEQFNEMIILENLISNTSTHAAGVVIAPDKISNYVPVMKSKNNDLMICQWHKKIVEEVGVYKFDFLGLKTLSILAYTRHYVLKNKGIDVDLDNFDVEAPEIYKQLSTGHFNGVFQFDADSAAAVVNELKPTCFNDIVIAESICRPGVKEAEMCIKNKVNGYKKTGIKPIDDILEETYGAIVYQEQTMNIMNKIAGWSLGFADKMRKVNNLEEYRDKFVEDSVKNGYTKEQANSIFDRFSMEYSFNKSHACAYGLLTAKTAYLLNKYPVEFMCAVMTITQYDEKGKEAIPEMIKECVKNDIKILPPDINISTNEFIPTEKGIVLPLTMINKVGDKAMETILENRTTPYLSFDDFMNRINKRNINKGVASNLIKGGAFDNLEGENRILLLKHFFDTRREKFEVNYTWSNDILYAFEREAIGINLTKSPLDNTICPRFDEIDESGTMFATCILHDVKEITDRNGNKMCFVTLETKYDIIKGVIFSRTYKQCKELIHENSMIKIYGKKDKGSLLINNLEK